MRSSRVIAATLLAATAVAGCPFITSGEGYGFVGAGGGGGGPGGATTTGPSTSSTGAQSSSSTGPMVCSPSATKPCYDGTPATTEGVGACKGGTETCAADGSGFGKCAGEITPQPDNCASKLNAHCDATELACTGTVSASAGRAWGEGGDDRGIGVAIDSQGNTIVCGFFNGMLDFGSGAATTLKTADGGSDGFVASYDPTGKCNWVVQLGGNGSDQATAVTVDANDNVFVVGSFNDKITFPSTSSVSPITGGPGIFVAEIDHAGTPQWGNGYLGDGNGVHVPQGVALSTDGTLLAIAGFTSDTLTIGGTQVTTQNQSDVDGFLFTLDSFGTKVGWVKQVTDGNGKNYQALHSVAIASDKSVVAVGEGFGNVDFGDGNLVTTHGNDLNVAIARYLADGSGIAWKQLVGDDGNAQSANGVALGLNDDVFVTGAFQKHLMFGTQSITTAGNAGPPTNAIFVARLDMTGAGIWAQAFTPVTGTLDDSAGIGVAVDAYGVVVGGFFTDNLMVGPTMLMSAGSRDAVAMKLAVTDGSVLWAKQFGGTGDDRINHVALDPRKTDPLGASAVVGSFTQQVNVGGGNVMGQGMFDMFFARMAP